MTTRCLLVDWFLTLMLDKYSGMQVSGFEDFITWAVMRCVLALSMWPPGVKLTDLLLQTIEWHLA